MIVHKIKSRCANGLKSIIKEPRYEEVKESRDHNQRLKNIAIHCIVENAPDQTTNKDKTFVGSSLNNSNN